MSPAASTNYWPAPRGLVSGCTSGSRSSFASASRARGHCTRTPLCRNPFTSVTSFFKAEDGIRGTSVTGVQTCALPISLAEGIIDHIVDHIVDGDLLAGAIAFARAKAAAGETRKVREQNAKIADHVAPAITLNAARSGLKKTARGAYAPY